MANPLRSLFLAVGVKGDAAVANLARVEAQADLTTASFIRLAEASLLAKRAMGMGNLTTGLRAVRAEMAALRREMLATNSAMVTFAERGRYAGMGMGGRNARPGGGAGDPRFRGGIGVGTSVFIGSLVFGVGASAFHQRAAAEKESMLASFAGGRSVPELMQESEERARRFNLTIAESARLLRQVEQLGLRGLPAQAGAVADAAAQFHILNEEVTADDAAAAIYRLIKATSEAGDEFENNLLAAERYASAIQIAGQNSAAGADAVFEMVRELQPLAQVMNLDAVDIISLAGAFSDLNEAQRELFRGSLTRMALTGTIDPNNPMSSLISMGQQLSGMQDFEQRRTFLASMGMTVRDPVTLSAIANELENLALTQTEVREELTGLGGPKIRDQVDTVLGGLQGRFDRLKSSLSVLGSRLIETVTPAIVALMEALTGLSDAIANNKLLQILLAGIGMRVIGGMARNLFVKSGMMGGGAGAMGMADDVAGMRGAARMNMAATLLSFVPGRGIAGLFRGMRAGSRAGLGAVNAAYGTTGTFADLVLGQGARGGPGAMQRFGGRFFGMFGARGVALTEMLAGRAAAGGIMGRVAMGALGGGPIGLIAMALGLLEKPFKNLSNWFNDLAEKGGILGWIFKSLSVTFQVLSILGKAVNWVFGKIGEVFMWFMDLLKPVGDFFIEVGNKVQDALGWVEGLFGDGDKPKEDAPAVQGLRGDTTIINNVQVGTSTGFEQWMSSNGASQAAALHYSRRTSLGGGP